MKESASIALAFIRSHHDELGISMEKIESTNVHIHVPEGATPKDGPSAGVTMLTALVSAFTSRKVKANLAMSGEITLRGKVLPVGGIKEKLLAAKRSGIKQIILSEQNKKDVLAIESEYLNGVKFTYVSRMSQVIEESLLKQKGSNKL